MGKYKYSRKTITGRQYRFCKRLPENLLNETVTNPVERSMIEAGYSPNSATEIANDVLQNPHVQACLERTMDEALRRESIDHNYLAKKLKEKSECHHPQFPDQPDNYNQLRALDMIANMMPNTYLPKKLEIEKKVINITFTADAIVMLEKAEKMREELGRTSEQP